MKSKLLPLVLAGTVGLGLALSPIAYADHHEKGEMKDEAKAEMKDEAKAEMKDEAKAEMKDEAKGEEKTE